MKEATFAPHAKMIRLNITARDTSSLSHHILHILRYISIKIFNILKLLVVTFLE